MKNCDLSIARRLSFCELNRIRRLNLDVCSRFNFHSDFQPLEIGIIIGLGPRTFYLSQKHLLNDNKIIDNRKFVKSAIWVPKSDIRCYFSPKNCFAKSFFYFCPLRRFIVEKFWMKIRSVLFISGFCLYISGLAHLTCYIVSKYYLYINLIQVNYQNYDAKVLPNFNSL